MRLTKRRREHGINMDMTPMIDVTFQLIIFFMTVSQQSIIMNAELELPKQAGALDQAEATIIVNVLQDGTLQVAGELMPTDRLKQIVAKEIQDKSGHPELVRVVLRVDQRGNSAAVNRVMVLLRQAGILRSRIAVEVPAD